MNHLGIDVEFWSYVQWKYPDSFRSFVPRDVRPDSEVRYIPDRYAFLEALDTLRLKNTMFILVNTTSGAVEKCLSETIVRKGGMYSYALLYALPPSRHMSLARIEYTVNLPSFQGKIPWKTPNPSPAPCGGFSPVPVSFISPSLFVEICGRMDCEVRE